MTADSSDNGRIMLAVLFREISTSAYSTTIYKSAMVVWHRIIPVLFEEAIPLTLSKYSISYISLGSKQWWL